MLVACGGAEALPNPSDATRFEEASDGSGSAPVDPWSAGPYLPGQTTLVLDDPVRGRTLVVEAWYPSQETASQGAPTETFESEPTHRQALEELLAAATSGCPTLATGATRDAAAATLGPRPVVLFSHCLNCGRYSSFSLAERLASHGMVVLAPDHAGPTPFVQGATGEALGEPQLEVRTADLESVLDAAIEGSLFVTSAPLEGVSVDPDRVGAFGHSFGAVTTGSFAQVEPRVRAVAALAAPMASFLFPTVSMSEISAPSMFVLAEEDNSILEIGNELLRQNADAANPPVWRVDIADAGHWSVSDLCGLTEAFAAGCGDGTRHSAGRDGQPFQYLAVSRGIELTQRYIGAFFLAHVAGDPDAAIALRAPPVEDGVTLVSRLSNGMNPRR